MSWSFRLARLFGTDVKVHFTFLLWLAILWGWWQVQAGLETAVAMTILFIAVFLCVLLHEFGHILMARRFRIRTPDVILLPIGGVARLERIPEEPRQEFLIAVAGPLVTLAIIGLLAVYLKLLGEPLPAPTEGLEVPSLWQALYYINLLLLLFNLVPAFPLDGGRILRALLATRMSHVRATRIAALVGQGAALLGAIAGAVAGQPMWVLIALFVFFGAGQEASMVQTRAAGRDIVIDQMMVTRFVTIPVYATLRQAVDLLLEGEQREFPVVDNAGRVEGLLTRDNLIRGLSSQGPEGLVSQAMTQPVPMLPLGIPFEQALTRLRASGLPALPVVNGDGALVGMLTLDNITDLILVRQATGGDG